MKSKNTGSAKSMGAKTTRKDSAKTPSIKDVEADKVKQTVKGRKFGPKASQKK